MNELENIIRLFNDVGMDLYSNIDGDYAESDIASFDCIEEYINISGMLPHSHCIYISYEEDLVIFDYKNLEYPGFWR